MDKALEERGLQNGKGGKWENKMEKIGWLALLCVQVGLMYCTLHFQGYQKMLDKLNFKRDKIVDIQKALQSADINHDKQLDFDEWRQDLKT